MADFRATTTVNVSEESLFGYLSRVGNLPHSFARMTSATPGVGEEVHTTARMPDGTEVEGEAWFRADTAPATVERLTEDRYVPR